MTSALKLPFGIEIDRSARPARYALVALILSAVMTLNACWFNPAWLTTAEQDLPVLINMALSIAQIVAVTSTGNPPSQTELNTINQISAVGTQGLTAIDNLYKAYNSGNATTTIAQIEQAATALQGQLQALLAAAQIKNSVLLNRVTAAVNLIVTTLNTFIGLLPRSTTPSALKAARKLSKSVVVPKPADLRMEWQQKVGFALAK